MPLLLNKAEEIAGLYKHNQYLLKLIKEDAVKPLEDETPHTLLVSKKPSNRQYGRWSNEDGQRHIVAISVWWCRLCQKFARWWFHVQKSPRYGIWFRHSSQGFKKAFLDFFFCFSPPSKRMFWRSLRVAPFWHRFRQSVLLQQKNAGLQSLLYLSVNRRSTKMGTANIAEQLRFMARFIGLLMNNFRRILKAVADLMCLRDAIVGEPAR